MKAASTLLVKKINLNLVRKQLLSRRTATRQQLARRTGLSLMTVSSIIAEMIDNGEVVEGNLQPSNGGRPSAEFCYNGEFNHAVILKGYQKDSRNFICMHVVNMFGECVYAEEKYFETIYCDSFDEMLNHAFTSVTNIAIIGLGLPGEEENGIVTINDYPQIIGKEFMIRCSRQYNVPVLFFNDINATVFGYYRKNYGPHPLNGALAGIYFPRLYYPGMGLMIGGEIHRGKQSFVGEFGSLPLGIEWDCLDYGNKPIVYDAVARLLAVVVCVVAPEKLVLYGDFFGEEDAASIKESAEDLLQHRFVVSLETKSTIEDDYECGLTLLTLDSLCNNLFGGFADL